MIAVLALVAVVDAAPMLRFENPMRDLERWWTARRLTSAWARGADEA